MIPLRNSEQCLERLTEALRRCVGQDRVAKHVTTLQFLSEEEVDEFNAAWAAAEEYFREQASET